MASLRTVSLASLLAALIAAPAWASGVQDAVGSASAGGYGEWYYFQPVYYSNTSQLLGPTTGASGYDAEHGLQSSAVINAGITALGVSAFSDQGHYADAGANLTYYGELHSTQNTLVPLHVTATLTSSVLISDNPSGLTEAEASLAIEPTGGYFGVDSTLDLNVYSDRSHGGHVLNINSVLMMPTNVPFYVELGAGVGAEGDSPEYQESAEASADPYFFIDPEYLTANPDTSLVFSDGVGNSPPASVPEPAEWALMVLGLSLLGAEARRRKAITRAATA